MLLFYFIKENSCFSFPSDITSFWKMLSQLSSKFSFTVVIKILLKQYAFRVINLILRCIPILTSWWRVIFFFFIHDRSNYLATRSQYKTNTNIKSCWKLSFALGYLQSTLWKFAAKWKSFPKWRIWWQVSKRKQEVWGEQTTVWKEKWDSIFFHKEFG